MTANCQPRRARLKARHRAGSGPESGGDGCGSMKCTIASIVLLILATDAGARTFKLVDNQTSELGADDSRPQTEHEESIGPNALREALQRGEILPLQVIMAAVRAR